MIDLEDGGGIIEAATPGQRLGFRRQIGQLVLSEAGGVAFAPLRHQAEFIVVGEFRGQRGGFEMVGGEKLRQGLDGLPHAVAVRTFRAHSEDLHAVDDLVLAGGQKLAFRSAFASFLAVDLHDAKPANRHRLHVGLMAKDGDGILCLVTHLFHIEGRCRIVNRREARRGAIVDIEDKVAVGVGQGLGQRHLDGLPVDLERDGLPVVLLAGIILPDEISLAVAAEEPLVVVANEKSGGWFGDGKFGGHGIKRLGPGKARRGRDGRPDRRRSS